jgi:hypothetical protein
MNSTSSKPTKNDCDPDCICCSMDENKLNMIMHILENDSEINKLLKNPKIAYAFSKFCDDTDTEDDLKDPKVHNFFQYLQFKIQLMSKIFVVNKKSTP